MINTHYNDYYDDCIDYDYFNDYDDYNNYGDYDDYASKQTHRLVFLDGPL